MSKTYELTSTLEAAFNQTEAGRQQGGKGTGLGLALVRQIVKLSGGRLGVSSKVGQGSTFWVELRRSPFPVCSISRLTTFLALGVGACALSILPQEQRPPLDDADSQRTIPSPQPPPTPDVEAQLRGHSGTVLEQTTSCDGLVQLMPRKRKVGDAVEHNGSRKGSAASNVAVPPVVGEDGEDESSRSGTPSWGPPTPAPNPTSTPISTPERPKTPPPRQKTQQDDSGQTREIKASRLVTRPTHVDLPPPPDLRALQSPPKTPSSPANRLPQIDVSPGLRVLVVDDDKMTRMLFQRMLGRLKCWVTTAVNGYEALQLITGDQNVSQTPVEEDHEHLFSNGEDDSSIVEKEGESKFAIVFLDNQMPVMSGVEMVRKLRKLGRKDLVVGVTGMNTLLLFFPGSGD